MTILNVQLANTPCYTDFPFLNQTGSDIDEGLAVIVDATKDLTSYAGVSIALPGADGVPAIGVTMEKIKNGQSGRVRCMGPIVPMKADGAITAGVHVMAGGTALKLGYAKAAGSAKSSFGLALNAATNDGDLVLVMLGTAKNA